MSETESGRGLWHHVKNALSGMVGRDALTPERKMEVEVTFGLIGFLAKADGLITSYEGEFTKQVFEAFSLNQEAQALARQWHDTGAAGKLDIEAEVKRFLALYGVGSAKMEQLFELLLRLSLSDGRVYPRERMALVRVAAAFGLTEKQLDQRMAMLSR